MTRLKLNTRNGGKNFNVTNEKKKTFEVYVDNLTCDKKFRQQKKPNAKLGKPPIQKLFVQMFELQEICK